MTAWIYKWLPIIFGCHCKKERSFHYKGKQFPICARCTGELVGMIAALFSCFFFRVPIYGCLLMMIPMIADGTIQMFSSYESNNRRRFITGILFGYGFMMVIVVSIIFTARLGLKCGMWMRQNR